ncbi:MAG: S1/P1 nuclease [Pseudomonadota bacterium]|nr:S1/P1 nuclease [Pseudomonadota bacterium]
MINRKTLIIVFSLCLWLWLSLSHVSRALAWGDIGHGAVGFIAEKNLTSKGRALVHQIIGIESLAIAAMWPDQSRSDERFKAFAPFHFFEIPPQFTFSTLPESDRAISDAHTIINQVPSMLIDAKLSREQKMILFRYLVHVVGDVHQPLHIGNGIDRGANLCSVNWTNPSTGLVESTNLHTAWDEKLIENIAQESKATNPSAPGIKRLFGYKEFADLILAETKNQKGEGDFASISRAPVPNWYDESRNLHSEVYPDVKPSTKPEERSYCKVVDKKTQKVTNGKFDPDKIPTLDSVYIQKSIPTLKKRVLYAGYRLAGLINKISEGSIQINRSINDDMKDLETITLKNSKSTRN